MAGRGRRQPPSAHYHRDREPRSRPTGGVPQPGPPRAGRGRYPSAGRQDRAAPQPLGPRPNGGGRSVAGRLAGLPRRLRLHQGTGRDRGDRDQGRPGSLHRAAVDHRVGLCRTVPRVDSWLPHGRAHHHRLRPGAAHRLPRHPPGSAGRDPGGSGGRGHLCGGRPGPRHRPPDHPGGVGSDQPISIQPAGGSGPQLVQRESHLRRPRPAHPPAQLDLSGPGPGGPPAQTAADRAERR